MARLVYFTDRYPFLEEWHPNDLAVLANHFEEILVAPLEYGESGLPPHLPGNVKVASPLFAAGVPPFGWIEASTYFIKRLDIHLAELAKTPASASWRNFKKYVICSSLGQRILDSEIFRIEVMPYLHGACLYYFWGLGYAESLPFLSRQLRTRSLVRFHGYDLYRDRNSGYIPYQRAIVEAAAVVAPVSEHGVRELGELFPSQKGKILCRRLGCLSRGTARPSRDGIFRIVSCAFANPVKRLQLIPLGLRMISRVVEWTHIGGGSEIEKVKEVLPQLGPNVTVKLIGNVPAPEVARIYANSPFDLFVSVSASEGVPVSIMEALAAGIPVLATDVGGVAEIVDSSVGDLLPHNFSSETFAERIEYFASLNESSIARLRANCIDRHAQSSDTNRNAAIMAETLLRLDRQF